MNHGRRSYALLLLAVACGIAKAQDPQRGLRNYQDILAGRKKLEQLTAQERDEVFQIHARVKAAQSRSGKSPSCQDAMARVESIADELADKSKRLRNCAESKNFSDDCSSEFRRVRSAQGDYESAVSTYKSECE